MDQFYSTDSSSHGDLCPHLPGPTPGTETDVAKRPPDGVACSTRLG